MNLSPSQNCEKMASHLNVALIEDRGVVRIIGDNLSVSTRGRLERHEIEVIGPTNDRLKTLQTRRSELYTEIEIMPD